MPDFLKSLIKPVVVFVVGLALGIGGSVLKFDLKAEVCKASAVSVER